MRGDNYTFARRTVEGTNAHIRGLLADNAARVNAVATLGEWDTRMRLLKKEKDLVHFMYPESAHRRAAEGPWPPEMVRLHARARHLSALRAQDAQHDPVARKIRDNRFYAEAEQQLAVLREWRRRGEVIDFRAQEAA